ncbi:related to Nbp35p and human nucleotide-binding protein [Cephalotrichum gorgonifer]|uniref:Related to Nbp35p and human nucleotide-binding protein n=1 Tax=Cephalotrichum gorgonifer TaxID=2041049 RepID=A0AAE8MQ54_9PEZI|nr:related to Nbp35p and human nucleotide-binding protein [Cephalotrichum gorgonifer]
MSMGYLVPEESPVVWRGPMVMKAVQQLLHEVDWGGIDVLVLDLPPGTGDTQLTISQQVVLDGALIVSTPHTLALKDAQKGIATFQKLDVPILGLIQNMSLYTCPHCSTPSHVFGSAARTRKLCSDSGIEFLGDVPLDPDVVEKEVDGGVRPAVVAEPEGKGAGIFRAFAERIAAGVGLA